MNEKVVRLIEKTSIGCNGSSDMADMLCAWAEQIRDGSCGDVHSMVVVIQDNNGKTYALRQSKAPIDMVRLVGLLQMTAHRIMTGADS